MENYARYDDQHHYGDEEVKNGVFQVVQCPSDAAALTNYADLAPGSIDAKIHYIIVARQYVFSVRYIYSNSS
jgi:vesicle-fusing ATPase